MAVLLADDSTEEDEDQDQDTMCEVCLMGAHNLCLCGGRFCL
jgi:hypothetical protein